MGKLFSVASWNVEHFGATKKTRALSRPIKPPLEFIAAQNADVIAIYEVRSSQVFKPLVEKLPGYTFHITEGPQTQEILVGVRHGIPSFVTQKVEFKAAQSSLRPGVLLTLFVKGEYYPILFLHLKSMTDPRGFGIRDEMLRRALKFRRVLNAKAIAGGSKTSNYIFVGDLNTMGLDYPYSKHDIPAEEEIHELKRRAKHHSKKMRVLEKNADATWCGGSGSKYPPSNLDHVVAADHLSFRQFGGAEVDVRGWPQEATKAARDKWTKKYSDHALLYFELRTP